MSAKDNASNATSNKEVLIISCALILIMGCRKKNVGTSSGSFARFHALAHVDLKDKASLMGGSPLLRRLLLFFLCFLPAVGGISFIEEAPPFVWSVLFCRTFRLAKWSAIFY